MRHRIRFPLLSLIAVAAAVAFPAAARAACPCMIWPSSTTPGTAAYPDNSAINVGVKFRSDQAGFVKGLRFYKGGGNTGTHVASLWSAGGALLASAPFTSETTSGWQEVDFAAPVAITANTTYVASYHTDAGFYAADGGFFANAGVDSPPLHALQDAVALGDGVYFYSGTSVFPTASFNSTNYWVDVVFDQTAGDSIAPTVTARTPAPGATGVAVSSPVTATFSEPVQPSTISMGLTGPLGATVAGTTSYDAPSRTATFTPTAALAYSTSYTAAVSGAQDPSGNTMTAVNWSFTTGAQPPPPPPPGSGPILLVSSSANPFTAYYRRPCMFRG